MHPSVDGLFQSAALAARRPVAVVMSGMGQDGAAGVAPLLARGGMVLVQEAASCVVAGMPGAAAAAARAAGMAVEAAAPAALGRRLARLLSTAPPPGPVAEAERKRP
ncbi:chemotaxis protein CheB [Teichococcus aestuarii]|uniref:chemotaxis protein CheB n=1 Tax=Teichococcus aestuarii TaxID=568898 RepID=UPI003606D7EF